MARWRQICITMRWIKTWWDGKSDRDEFIKDLRIWILMSSGIIQSNLIKTVSLLLFDNIETKAPRLGSKLRFKVQNSPLINF